VRAAVAARLAYLGVVVEPAVNQATSGDGLINGPDTPPTAVVVTAREDVEIGGQVRQLLASV
jgi:acetate kinase